MTDAIARFNRRYPRMAAIWPQFRGPERSWIDVVRLGAASAILCARMDAWYRGRFGKRPVETEEDYQRYLVAREREQGKLFA